jgi:general secretion pathway protein G
MRDESQGDWLPLRGCLLRAIRWGIGIFVGWCVCSLVFGPQSWPTQKGQVATAKLQIAYFKSGLELYALDNGHVPSTLQGLDALIARPTLPPLPAKWRGPYLKDTAGVPQGAVPMDPWGHPYHYQSAGDDESACLVVSYGEDGRAGGSGYAADLSGGFTSTRAAD